MSLPISFLCDRHTVNIPESQDGEFGYCSQWQQSFIYVPLLFSHIQDLLVLW